MNQAASPVGKTFNYLVVMAETPKPSRRWLCRCICGAQKLIDPSNVRSGSIKSCGCKRYTPGHVAVKHGLSKRGGAYTSWCAMRTRCNNPQSDCYHRYGGRGITVCARWDSFENFLADMGPRPAGMTLERKENSGNYEPGNCVWATRAQQALNTCQNRIEQCFGASKTVIEWTRDPRCIVNERTLQSRLSRGWSFTRAMTVPRSSKGRRVRASA